MKSLVLYCALSALIISGCATQKGTKEDYFGYNNSPTINESTEKPTVPSKPRRSALPTDTAITKADAPQAEWVNPMVQNDDPQEDYQDDPSGQAITAGYHPYSSPQYVPVIVPWWDSYSGWMGGYYSRPVIVVRYQNWYWGWNSYCDWYSPYYAYHPWYGGYFSYYRPRYYGWDHDYWRPWHHYPIYSYGHTNPLPRKPNTVRSWGPTRGETSPTSGGVRGTTVTTPNPISGTPSLRNERGQGAGTQQTKSTNTNASPTLRNERGNSNTSPQQPQNQHPLKRSETTPSTNSPKSGTSPNATDAPVRRERATKEATPTPRTESKMPSTSTPRQERSAPSASPTPRSSSAPSPSSSTSTPRGTRKP